MFIIQVLDLEDWKVKHPTNTTQDKNVGLPVPKPFDTQTWVQ
jgi:hypothetical protein